MNALNRAGAMQADSTIWFAAPRLPPLVGLLMILWVKFRARGGVLNPRHELKVKVPLLL